MHPNDAFMQKNDACVQSNEHVCIRVMIACNLVMVVCANVINSCRQWSVMGTRDLMGGSHLVGSDHQKEIAYLLSSNLKR